MDFPWPITKEAGPLLRIIRDRLARIAKQVLGIPVYRKQLLEEGYRSVARFFSFLQKDFSNIFAESSE